MTTPCPGGPAQDPQVVTNPPGLAQISYRVDDFTGFRRALLRPLPAEQAIGAWQPAPGDLGLQVLEWWAYLGDVLTFYNERIANESYLRTATMAGSVGNLVALLGYQASPGVSATGSVAAMRTAARPNEPLVIPAGLRLTSTATPGVGAQAFEVDAAASFTGVSSVPVTVPPDTTLAINSDGTPRAVLLAGPVTGVKPGDRLLLVGQGFAGADDNWSLVTVSALTPQPDPVTGTVNTCVSFAAGGGWGPTPAPAPPPAPTWPSTATATATIIDQSAFGVGDEDSTLRFAGSADFVDTVVSGGFHWVQGMAATSPTPGSVLPSTSYRLLRPNASAALWTAASPAGSQQQVVEQTSSTGSALTVRLSAAVRAIAPGDMILFDGGAGSPSALAVAAASTEELWVVSYPAGMFPATTATGASPSPPIPSAIAVPHTALTVTLAALDAWALLDVAADSTASTVAVRYAFKDVAPIIGVPQATLPSLSPTPLTVPASYTPSPGATAFLVDSTGTGILVTVSAAGTGQVTLTGAGSPAATITTPLVVPLQLLLDVVPVSRGTTVAGEMLGSGNAALINQSFTLSKSPLTYLASGNGSVAALAVYVNGVQWQETPSFYGQPPNAAVFVVSRSADQTVTTVTFGDGVNGARLTTGTGNVTATYRYGSGAASPPAGRLTTISQPQPNLASIQNPVAVSPGADPQSPGDVRANAPASVFTFGRAISAVDYQTVASQAPGVSRVTAYWTFDQAEQRTLVKIYVDGGPAGAAAASAAIAGSGDPNRPVSVVSATATDLTLSCTLVVAANRQAPAVAAAAAAAVGDSAGGLFSPARMGIGQRLYRSAVEAALSVPGVVAVHGLTVVRPVPAFVGFPLIGDVLDEFFDPGEGAFFDLPPGNVSVTGVSAGG
jgi:predicted phage baseplate assembly protein